MLIGGRLAAGDGDALTVTDPATERTAATVLTATDDQVAAAVHAARHAFDTGSWARAGEERSAALHRLADGFAKHQDELVEALVTETGTPVSVARSLQVGWPMKHLRHYAEEALRDREEALGTHDDPVLSMSVVAYRPVGVVAAIAAYNFPLLLAVHKLGAALAAGCTVVLMPSPRTPVATLLLARIVAEADLPPGVVNVIVGTAATARHLTEHPGVDKVAFTGSTQVGEQVMRQAAAGLRGVVLELGGKSPAIMLPGTDVRAMAPDLHRRYCRNGGQACAAPTRLLVPEPSWEEFLDVSRETYAGIKVGDPWDTDTIVGPMISAAHRTRVEGHVEAALTRGAVLAAGGGRPALTRGWYTNPALIIDADNSWPIAQEEIFGPVAVAYRYRSVDEAVALANDSRYGLHAYLFAPRLEDALEIAPRMRSGSVTINGGGGFRPDAPMGGFGASGIGRELGRWGIHEYLEPQHVQWPVRTG